MPYRKTYARKKNYRRRFRRRKRNNIVNPSAFPVPKTLTTRLRYCERFSLNPAAGAVSARTFQINGLYDLVPGLGGAEQPMGFDELMTFYNRYCVLSCKAMLQAHSNSSGGNTTSTVGLQGHSNQSYTPASLPWIIERGRTRWRHLGTSTGGMPSATVKYGTSVRSWIGKNPKMDDTYYGTATSNPTDGIFISAYSAAETTLDDPPDCDCVITLDFIVQFSDIKQFDRSV